MNSFKLSLLISLVVGLVPMKATPLTIAPGTAIAQTPTPSVLPATSDPTPVPPPNITTAARARTAFRQVKFLRILKPLSQSSV
jgi:hypothetical protein